jgi:NAD+ kinase
VSAAISRVGLVAKHRVEAAAGVLLDLAAWLELRGIAPVFDDETAQLAGAGGRWDAIAKDELPKACDLIVLLGGDGTLIGMARRIARADADVPIAGVNFGSLGFLTEITLDDLYPSLEAVFDGTAPIEERMMLHARTLRGGKTFTDELVLNDVVITKAALSRIIELSVCIGSDEVVRIRADGLIVATPTGSTAYNLAAGGPIVQPVVDAVLLTPIAPHMLTNRPLVVAGTSAISVAPDMNGNDEVFVTFDGQSGHALQAGDVVVIERAARPLRLVRSAHRSYFDVLRQKLKWGAR